VVGLSVTSKFSQKFWSTNPHVGCFRWMNIFPKWFWVFNNNMIISYSVKSVLYSKNVKQNILIDPSKVKRLRRVSSISIYLSRRKLVLSREFALNKMGEIKSCTKNIGPTKTFLSLVGENPRKDCYKSFTKEFLGSKPEILVCSHWKFCPNLRTYNRFPLWKYV
jgi:hypothetical protein